MLSVCLITKNEEKNLPRCLDSISSIADEIIIVDTGSNDKTIEIAKDFGAKVYHHPWNNNFSEARNFGLDKCTQDWILSIDADEELFKDHAHLLKHRLESAQDREAFYLRLKNIIGTTIINETHSLRVFRNRPHYRYTGRLHEQIFFAINDNNPEEVFEGTDFILNHYGYDHNAFNMDDKIKRNIEILEGTPWEERNGFFYFSLGSEYLKLNNTVSANECFVKALENPSKDYGVEPYLCLSLARTCLDLREYNSGINYIENHFSFLYDFKDLHFLKASIYYELMMFSKSYDSLMKFINSEPNNKYPSFHFEQNNDVYALLNGLQSLVIPKIDKNLITVVNVEKSFTNLEDVIKNANEISSEVIVLSKIDLNQNIQKRISECGASLLFDEFQSTNNTKTYLKQAYPNSWILLLNENQVLSHEDRIDLYYLSINDTYVTKNKFDIIQTN